MTQFSLISDSSLLVRDDQGRYLPATADQILRAARQVIDQKIQRGASFTPLAIVKEFLCAMLAGFDHEVFACLFLDSQHRLIEYAELFRGTIDGAAVYPREVVKMALQVNAAAVIFSHIRAGIPSRARRTGRLPSGSKRRSRWWTCVPWTTLSSAATRHRHSPSGGSCSTGASAPILLRRVLLPGPVSFALTEALDVCIIDQIVGAEIQGAVA